MSIDLLEFHKELYYYCLDERDKAIQRQKDGPVADLVANKAAEIAYQALMEDHDAWIQRLKTL